jgi:hypothetical protein
MSEQQPDLQTATMNFLREHFQAENIEGTIVAFFNNHFPSISRRNNESEQTIIRALSYMIRYASKYAHNIKHQALLGLLYGMLQLYGVKGTTLIIIKGALQEMQGKR